ncbi:cytochrome b562 [uncultured Amphritea sp.]|uniref:cytochrome b562 n=1 Tax=uncultured Amphritea sp. TaxID=981605 RepID=UPI002632BED0|nr:cytochrome b562 [uncultured Amphritea sp.]
MFLKTLYKFSLSSVFMSLCLGLLLSSSASAGQLKPTMKEMRLHYKQAIDTQDPAVFNEKIAQFLTELQTAQAFKFSPERKVLSLEGLDKVETLVSGLPTATDTNLSQLQNQLKEVDQLRVEYHKKVKPGVFELLLDTLKEAIGL